MREKSTCRPEIGRSVNQGEAGFGPLCASLRGGQLSAWNARVPALSVKGKGAQVPNISGPMLTCRDREFGALIKTFLKIKRFGCSVALPITGQLSEERSGPALGCEDAGRGRGSGADCCGFVCLDGLQRSGRTCSSISLHLVGNQEPI